jgi:hypothetical protein
MKMSDNLSDVMRGLDPRIHDAPPSRKNLQLSSAARHHGLPGQARQ